MTARGILSVDKDAGAGGRVAADITGTTGHGAAEVFGVQGLLEKAGSILPTGRTTKEDVKTSLETSGAKTLQALGQVDYAKISSGMNILGKSLETLTGAVDEAVKKIKTSVGGQIQAMKPSTERINGSPDTRAPVGARGQY
jgi:hypothetical protein